MQIIWVRHAEPERVEGGNGVPANPPLTARGRRQAERVAAWLALEPVDAVVSSPQLRARETALPVAVAHGLTVDVLDGLVEYDVQADHYIPMEELRAGEGRALARDDRGALGRVRRRGTRRLHGPRARDGAIRSSARIPGRRSWRCATAV